MLSGGTLSLLESSDSSPLQIRQEVDAAYCSSKS